MIMHERDGEMWPTWLDPGPPVYTGGDQPFAEDSMYKHHFAMVSIWQSHHDPYNGVMVDASPATIGNVQSLPEDIADYGDFYTYLEGGDVGIGHDLNPHTGLPYEEQIVPLGDYARILAEFWADGPDSETPPVTGSASSMRSCPTRTSPAIGWARVMNSTPCSTR